MREDSGEAGLPMQFIYTWVWRGVRVVNSYQPPLSLRWNGGVWMKSAPHIAYAI